MIIFKNREKNLYLITNYKVMFSTLQKQDNLVRVFPNKRLYFLAIMSWIGSSHKFYLVVRNPFDRIVSFYVSKFKKAEQVRLWMLQNEKGIKWQACTTHFFSFLDLDKGMEPKVVSKKLMTTEFDDMVSILPHVYMKDKHMIPQYFSRKLTFKTYGVLIHIPINFQRIFKFENKDDLLEIAKIFNINLSIKHNNTENLKETIDWNSKTKMIVSNLYKKDVKYFNY